MVGYRNVNRRRLVPVAINGSYTKCAIHGFVGIVAPEEHNFAPISDQGKSGRLDTLEQGAVNHSNTQAKIGRPRLRIGQTKRQLHAAQFTAIPIAGGCIFRTRDRDGQ
jgi:hypothetical protein